MTKPLVSIIIPVWNTGKKVNRIVEQITRQNFSDFELILVDDGSSDDTLSVLRQLEQTDERIAVYTKPNGGPSSARNVGLEAAVGEFIQFYDADDRIEPEAITDIVKLAQSNNSDVVVSGWSIDLGTSGGLIKDYKKITFSEESITGDIREYVVRSLGENGKLYNLWNKLFRANIIREHGLRFREDLRFGEDLIFSLEYMKFARQIDVVPIISYHYQTNGELSVFSASSIVPAYRQTNDQALVKFADGKFADLVNWVRWRWLMSYWSLVAGSNKKLAEKLTLIKEFQPSDLPTSSLSSIGLKKYALQTLARLSKVTSFSALLLGWGMVMLKKAVVSIKTALKQSK